jgi:hypothetical protein
MSGARAARRVAAVAIAILGSVALGHVWAERAAPPPLPHVTPRTPVLFDTRPIPVTITVLWERVARTGTVHQVLTDHTLWRRMHLGDWDRMEAGTRERALARMLDQYGHVLDATAWSGLTIHDWDLVPQPVRALAYIRLVRHWVARYDVGAGYAPDHEIVWRTVAAIVMAESWFEHRAVNENPWGNIDLGLAGCSNWCRRVLGEMAEEEKVDFVLADEDYLDPWNGTRVAAVWFGRELVRAEGDLDLAIAAYHRGLPAARRGEGAAYVANVHRLRSRYIDGVDPPPAWAFLHVEAMRRDAALTAD